MVQASPGAEVDRAIVEVGARCESEAEDLYYAAVSRRREQEFIRTFGPQRPASH